MNENKNAKTVIHVVQHLAPGGLEILALDFLKFTHAPDRAIIVSLEGSNETSIANWPKLEEYRDNILFLNKHPGVQLSIVTDLISLFNDIQPDVVHTHHIGPLLYAGVAARLAGVPKRIHTEHDAWHLNNSKHRRIENWALKAAQPTLVADATRVYDQLQSMFSYRNIVTIKNGIDCEKFKPGNKLVSRLIFELPHDKTIIGCAGRLEEVKGQDQLIKALAMLPSNIVVAFAGDGREKDRLKLLVEQLGLENRVYFLGLIDDMACFYQSLDLFCLPSRHEGLPLSTLEAQACNVPTIATNVGAVSETLCPTTSYLTQSNNIVALAHDILSSYMGMHDTKLSANSPRNFVLENFNVRSMVKSYDQLANEVYA
ncbi:glycosyltransferase [Vibrio makurazakiensis]|uniref:glycosyltransferase n=1 Tax=Vibrio makurazakiensis TaxID=2910250 RepID=UPI003D0B9746